MSPLKNCVSTIGYIRKCSKIVFDALNEENPIYEHKNYIHDRFKSTKKSL